MAFTARFQLDHVQKQSDGQTHVALSPVHHEDDAEHPNREIWNGTAPVTGGLQLTITNPEVAAQFQPQHGFFLLTLESQTAGQEQPKQIGHDEAEAQTEQH